MLLLADTLKNNLRYNRWATARLLEAAGSLTEAELTRDFATADKSVLGTLVHIYRSDRAWLGRVDPSRPPAPWDLPEDQDWNVLTTEWPRLQSAWIEWSETLDDHSIAQPLPYRDRKGNPWSDPLSAIILHVVNHGTHHRGQVSGFLRALGTTPPPLDFIAYSRGLGQ